MEEKQFSDYLAAWRRQKTPCLLIFLGFFGLSLAFAMLWPPVYRSAATILIEEQEIPVELVRSTITSFAAQRLQVVSQRVMTRAHLLDIIKKFNLYAKERKKKTSDDIIERMHGDIAFETISAEVIDPRSGHPTRATIAFSLSFDGPTPDLTQKVSNEIASLYLEENLKNRSQKTAETSEFIRAEVDQISATGAELKNKLAAFKKANLKELPEQKQLTSQMLARCEKEIDEIDMQTRMIQERLSLIESQLFQISPESPAYSSEGQRVTSPSDRLKTLRTAYISLTSRYAETHPDVVKMKQEIEALEREVGQVDASTEQHNALAVLREKRLALSGKYAENHPDILSLDKKISSLEAQLDHHTHARTAATKLSNTESDNPAYLNLLAQKEASTFEITSLGKRRVELRQKIQDYEKRLLKTPEIERQYLVLARDWENATNRYRELKAKLMEAEIAQQLERKSKGERFSIIEPPLLPEKPIKPNRPLIATIGFVLALAAAFGYVFARASFDATLRTGKHVAAIAGVPPMAIIPNLDLALEGPGRGRRAWLFAGVLATLLVACLALAHWFWIPLDVLWFRCLRKFDALLG
jgi:uncharacterized protein involved in exopolysaccharide biosynthesis